MYIMNISNGFISTRSFKMEQIGLLVIINHKHRTYIIHQSAYGLPVVLPVCLCICLSIALSDYLSTLPRFDNLGIFT